MKVAIFVITLFALTAFAQEEQYQRDVEYFGLPSFSQIKNSASHIGSSGLRGAATVAIGISRGTDDETEDLNLLDRQQVANGFNKAGKVAGIVSKVTGAVSKVAGKVSSGLNWIGNKIGNKNGNKNGGKELEVVVAEANLY